ncbi:hypothetical protein F2Q68_00019684 [Brassica cretica]|uniref:Uncharacterized protein n=1 Tax=Brassica cretica TaxID=69181 RepID=A0A8S9FYI9_BRACR|nr:hypothetical protein F2Q68_00019684 [Brassica cretica]
MTQEKKRKNLREGEWKSAPEKPELKLETKNNIPNPTKHTQRKTLSKSGVANMAKGRATRDASNDVRCNEMREQREKRRRNEISKS